MKMRNGNTVCRICKHPYRHHCLFVYVQQGDTGQQYIKPIEIVPCNGTDFMNGSPCGCLQYEPIDNLEYLEWKSEEQESKTIDDTTW